MVRRWRPAVFERQQMAFAALDDWIAEEHPVRTLDAVFQALDFSAWENKYSDGEQGGAPPVHPRLMAGSILYGLLRGIKSSRQLEDATRHRVDFQWLLEGRVIDHSTFAAFRNHFGDELKALNHEITKMALSKARSRLATLVIDGTAVRANSGRHGARTPAALEKLIDRCTAELDKRMHEWAQADAREMPESAAPETLQKEIARLNAELEKYKQAYDVARERDAAKQAHQRGPAVRVPVTDTDASLLQNKDGGYAPNYTTTVTVDETSGVIVHGDVVEGRTECDAMGPSIESATRLAESLGVDGPDTMLADQGFDKGEKLEQLDSRGVEALIPTGEDFSKHNPARREDPTQPVNEKEIENLPKQGGCFSRAAFVYDDEKDCYYCPNGRSLTRTSENATRKHGVKGWYYQSENCDDCPLQDQCLKGKSKRRTIWRDKYQKHRDATSQRMATEEAQTRYRRRAPVVEGVIGVVKHAMGIRQFAHRGMKKVRTEWQWICGAFNLGKLLRLLADEKRKNRPGKPVKAWKTAPQA